MLFVQVCINIPAYRKERRDENKRGGYLNYSTDIAIIGTSLASILQLVEFPTEMSKKKNTPKNHVKLWTEVSNDKPMHLVTLLAVLLCSVSKFVGNSQYVKSPLSETAAAVHAANTYYKELCKCKFSYQCLTPSHVLNP